MSGVETRYVGKNETDQRLDKWFKHHFPALPFGRLQKLLRTGQIRVDGKRAKTNTRIESGQSIRIPPLDAADSSSDSQNRKPASNPKDRAFIRSLVIYSDKNVIAIDKPAGLAVQGGTNTERHIDGMLDHLTDYDDLSTGERPRLVHRLDKDTSGVMVLARTLKAAQKLSDAFRKKDSRKIYWAVTVGVPKPAEGEIDMPLAKGGGAGQERVFGDREEGKSAITWFKVLDHAAHKAAVVALWPRTGRTHQLRAHMEIIGTPILGDGKYGGQEAFLGGEGIAKQVHLHARELVLPGMDGKKTGPRILAAVPEHMMQTFEVLGIDPLIHGDIDPFVDFVAPS